MENEIETELFNFVKQIDDVIKKQGDLDERVGEMGESILTGFERNEIAIKELTRLFKVISSQLDSPLKTDLDYKRLYPEDIKVSNLKEIKIPDEVAVKRPAWYEKVDFDPLIKAIQKQYNVPLEDVVYGNLQNTTGQDLVCIPAQKGYRIYVTDVAISNHSSTGVICEIKSGKTTWTLPAPVNNGVGGSIKGFTAPLPGEFDKPWTFRTSSAVNAVYCSMVGFKSKV